IRLLMDWKVDGLSEKPAIDRSIGNVDGWTAFDLSLFHTHESGRPVLPLELVKQLDPHHLPPQVYVYSTKWVQLSVGALEYILGTGEVDTSTRVGPELLAYMLANAGELGPRHPFSNSKRTTDDLEH